MTARMDDRTEAVRARRKIEQAVMNFLKNLFEEKGNAKPAPVLMTTYIGYARSRLLQ